MIINYILFMWETIFSLLLLTKSWVREPLLNSFENMLKYLTLSLYLNPNSLKLKPNEDDIRKAFDQHLMLFLLWIKFIIAGQYGKCYIIINV